MPKCPYYRGVPIKRLADKKSRTHVLSMKRQSTLTVTSFFCNCNCNCNCRQLQQINLLNSVFLIDRQRTYFINPRKSVITFAQTNLYILKCAKTLTQVGRRCINEYRQCTVSVKRDWRSVRVCHYGYGKVPVVRINGVRNKRVIFFKKCMRFSSGQTKLSVKLGCPC